MRFPVLAAALLLAACAGDRYPPASPSYDPGATVPGFEDIRFLGVAGPEDAVAYMETQRAQVRVRAQAEGGLPNGGRFDVLILSGGGADGAYGAGLLNGWTERGDRPEFSLVTGISTGALIAPLAFLGPEYDAELKDVYTNTSTDALVEFTPLRAIFRGFGLTDTTRMEARMARAVTPEAVARIGEEHRKGRRLWIGTTNLDAQRPVVWDIGAIAASGRPDAPALIRRIMLASASIPGAFPPVLIEVESGGNRWSEMHVDGGVTRQLFFYPPSVRLPPPGDGPWAMRRGTVYAIRNTKLAPDYRPVSAGIVPISARSLATMIKAGGVNDLVVVTEQARQGGFGLKLTAVPDSFDLEPEEFFDPVYMRALYDLGHAMALEGTQWSDGLEDAAQAAKN